MMKKTTMIIGLTIAALFLSSHTVFARGTFILGAKGWYTVWESGILDWFEQDITKTFADNGVQLDSNFDTGTGYLAGPLIGYQSESKRWAFSFAAMVFGKFNQDWEGSADVMEIDTSVDTSRMDFDLVISYSLMDLEDSWSFFKYSKVFLGYKHQIVDYELSLTYETFMGPRSFDYKLDSTIYMPSLGVGFAYPLLDQLALGLQLGLLYAFIDLEMTDPDGDKFDIWPHPSFGGNGELTLTYLPVSSLAIQLGFKAQYYTIEARSPGEWEKTSSPDINYGPTFSIYFLF